jgi:hypothetical protein
MTITRYRTYGKELLDMKSGILTTIFALLIPCLTGCSMGRADGAIPFGTWEGQGVYAGHDMASDESNGSTPQPGKKAVHTGTYHTTLSIRPTREGGREFIELKIQSHHEGNPDFDGKIVFIATMLEKSERISNSCVLYNLIKKDYDMGLKEPSTYVDADPPVLASCISQGGESVLVIEYDSNFVEVFRFRNDRVQKTGAYSNKDSAIHWSEELKRK